MEKSSIKIGIAIVLGVFLLSTSFLQVQKKEAPLAKEKKYADNCSEQPFKLLFSTAQDITNTWGQIHFSVTPLSMIREVEKPPFNLVGCFPLADGTWEVFFHEYEREPRRWNLLRGITTDGVTFSNVETVIPDTTGGSWFYFVTMAYNPDAGEYLMIKADMDRNGVTYHAWFSSDGRQWQKYSGNRPRGGIFYDNDYGTVFWSPVLKRYVFVSKSIQAWEEKRYSDVMPHQAHHRYNRRVLMIRTSPDGRNWTPDVDMDNIFNNAGNGVVHIPTNLLTTPDANDPSDMEFYSGTAFWYHDRAYMIVCNYTPSPLAPNRHGPHLDTEWWVSYDGLRWERPARGVNASDYSFMRPTHDPLLIGDQLLLNQDKRLLGIKRDRISFVSARANAEFSTRPFMMPAADLVLNAAIPSPERPFAESSAYVMVDILDEQGQIIPGFEANKCVIQKANGIELPLRWDAKSARELAGRQISLRFYLLSANIYAVTTK
jgi:hypothetical protein